MALTHSPNGTTPSSDFNFFGRNAIRWHNGNHNGVTIWKDYKTENFPGYQPAISNHNTNSPTNKKPIVRVVIM